MIFPLGRILPPQLERARAQLRLPGNPEAGAADLERASVLLPADPRPDPRPDTQRAILAKKQGQVAEYRRLCTALLTRFGERENPHVLAPVLWACALVPGAVNDPKRLAVLA